MTSIGNFVGAPGLSPATSKRVNSKMAQDSSATVFDKLLDEKPSSGYSDVGKHTEKRAEIGQPSLFSPPLDQSWLKLPPSSVNTNGTASAVKSLNEVGSPKLVDTITAHHLVLQTANSRGSDRRTTESGEGWRVRLNAKYIREQLLERKLNLKHSNEQGGGSSGASRERQLGLSFMGQWASGVLAYTDPASQGDLPLAEPVSGITLGATVAPLQPLIPSLKPLPLRLPSLDEAGIANAWSLNPWSLRYSGKQTETRITPRTPRPIVTANNFPQVVVVVLDGESKVYIGSRQSESSLLAALPHSLIQLNQKSPIVELRFNGVTLYKQDYGNGNIRNRH